MSSAPPPSEQPAATTPDTAATGMSPAAPESAATVNSRDSLTRGAHAAATGAASRATSPKPAATRAAAPKAASSSPAHQTATQQDTAKQDTTKQDTTAKQAAAAPAGGGPTSPQLVALGDSIFHGQVAGGTCTACHGQDAKGTAVAPNLTDNQWINGDGSYDFIVHTVTTGVPQPKQHPAPMPPKGGATLSDQQVKAVAAYVYSLSHKS
jgi:mono/diheme cytochrome c family protein